MVTVKHTLPVGTVLDRSDAQIQFVACAHAIRRREPHHCRVSRRAHDTLGCGELRARGAAQITQKACRTLDCSTAHHAKPSQHFLSPAGQAESPSPAGGSDGRVSAIAPREHDDACASDGERDAARFRPDSLVIKGFTFSVLARPSFHRIDFLLLLKRYAEKYFCADG